MWHIASVGHVAVLRGAGFRTRLHGRGTSAARFGVCVMCEEGGADKKYKGFYFHTEPCYNAVRARKRQTKKSPTLAAEDDRDLRVDIVRFREKHEQFLSKNSEDRRAARLQAQMDVDVEENIDYKRDAMLEDQIVLNATRYASYRKFWDGCGSDTCDEDFNELHRDQGGEHDEDHGDGGKVQRVAVADNSRFRVEKGTKHSTGTRSQGPSQPPDSGTSPPPTKRAKVAGNGGSIAGAAGSISGAAFRSPSEANVSGLSGSSAPTTVDRHAAGSKGVLSAVVSKPEHLGKLAALGVGDDDNQQLLGVTFLKEKEFAKADIEILMGRVVGPKGARTNLATAMSELKSKSGLPLLCGRGCRD